jgi:hypothetical protein
MKQKDDLARLRDMLFYANEARSIAEGKDEADLEQDKVLK